MRNNTVVELACCAFKKGGMGQASHCGNLNHFTRGRVQNGLYFVFCDVLLMQQVMRAVRTLLL